MSYGEFATRLRERQLARMLPAERGAHYPRGVAEATRQSVGVAEHADPTGLTRNVLRLVSLLAPEGIDLDLLSGLLPQTDPEAVEQVLADLVGSSLLGWTESGTGVTVHRLVARAVRDSAHAGGELAELLQRTADGMRAGPPAVDAIWASRVGAASLVGHAGHLWDVAVAAAGRDPSLTATVQNMYPLVNWAARHLEAIADLHRAIALADQLAMG